MTDRALRAAVALVALAGVGVAGYLTYTHYDEEALVCTTGGCEQVQQSEPDPTKVEKTEDGKTIYHYDPAKCVSIILLVSPRS